MNLQHSVDAHGGTIVERSNRFQEKVSAIHILQSLLTPLIFNQLKFRNEVQICFVHKFVRLMNKIQT